jgi:MFS family permease
MLRDHRHPHDAQRPHRRRAPDGTRPHLGYQIGLVWIRDAGVPLGCAMGIGKAAVYKHIPEYFPDNVGSVGGLVGMLGGLGGFFLPPLFAYTKAWSGFPSSTFFCLFLVTAICAVWMHVTVVQMLHEGSPSPDSRPTQHPRLDRTRPQEEARMSTTMTPTTKGARLAASPGTREREPGTRARLEDPHRSPPSP